MKAHMNIVIIMTNTKYMTDVLSGIPHGSVLRPLLFVLYVNDVSDMVKCFTVVC